MNTFLHRRFPIGRIPGIPAGCLVSSADDYCRGEWENWYRGCKKLNVSATLKRTRDSLEQSRQESSTSGIEP